LMKLFLGLPRLNIPDSRFLRSFSRRLRFFKLDFPPRNAACFFCHIERGIDRHSIEPGFKGRFEFKGL